MEKGGIAAEFSFLIKLPLKKRNDLELYRALQCKKTLYSY